MKKTMLCFASVLVLATLAGCASFEEIKTKADSGDPAMQYKVGVCYRDGKDVPRNLDTAYDYFKKSADGGSFSGALAYAKEALRRKDISEPEKFLERIQQAFSNETLDFVEHMAAETIKINYPKFCISYARNLEHAKAEKQLQGFKENALRYFDRYSVEWRRKYGDELKSIGANVSDVNSEHVAMNKTWENERRQRPDESRDKYKERIYKLLRDEADCPPRSGESFDEWRSRVAHSKSEAKRRRARPRTLDEAMADSRREQRQLEEQRAADRRFYAAKRAFDKKCHDEEEQMRVDAKAKAKAREKAENDRRRIEAKATIDRKLADPEFKYPYAKQFAGIELTKGIFSGLSCQWVFLARHVEAFKKSNKDDREWNALIDASETSKDQIIHKMIDLGIPFYDKQYGILYRYKLEIDGKPDSVNRKIAEYKTKFPDLKHSRNVERDSQKYSGTLDDAILTCVVKWTIYTDVLESERLKVIIESQSINSIDAEYFGDGLSELQKKREAKAYGDLVEAKHKKTEAVVTIIDKAMKKYLETLKK